MSFGRSLFTSTLLVLFAFGVFHRGRAQSTARGTDALVAAAESGNWERTKSLALVLLKSDRRNAAAWTYLGLADDHLGQKQKALGDFAEAVRLAPKATFTHNNYGASLEANGRPKQALEEYRRSLVLDRQQPAALVNLARLLAVDGESGERGEAQALLRSAWELAPDAEIARSLLLLTPCALGSVAAVAPPVELAAYARAVAESAAAVPRQEQMRVGQALLRCGLNDSAAAYYGVLMAANPKDADAIVGKADAELAGGHAREAGMTLERGVAGGIESAAVYAELGRIYQQTGHMDYAVDAMRRAVELMPGDEALQFRYGMLLLDAHAPKAAELRMQQAVDRAPKSARLWFVLGLAQFDDTRPAAAQISLDRSIALDAGFAPAMAYRGLAALDQQRYAEAEQWYRRALTVDSSAGHMHCLLAEALEREHPGDSKEARAELERALALDPKLATAYLSLGRLDLADARPEEAARELKAALRLDPSQRQAHFYLARAYRQLHQGDRAAAEAKLFSEQDAAAQKADRTALQDALRQFAHTRF